MKIIRVYTPYHITGFWYPFNGLDPLYSGSAGAGIVLESRAIATIRPCSETIESSSILDEVTDYALKILGIDRDKIYPIDLVEVYPRGYGYGASASRALSLTTAIALSKGIRSILRIAQAVHVSEVVLGTGYADVIAEFMGKGLTVRLKIGGPGIGVVDTIPIKRYGVLTAIVREPLHTKDMHRVYAEKLYYCGYRAYRNFIERYSFEAFIEEAKRFSECVGFLTNNLRDRIDRCINSYIAKGDVLGYFVKKSLLVVIVEEDRLEEIGKVLENTLRTRVSRDKIGFKGFEVEIL